jgi:hypothetical protein
MQPYNQNAFGQYQQLQPLQQQPQLQPAFGQPQPQPAFGQPQHIGAMYTQQYPLQQADGQLLQQPQVVYTQPAFQQPRVGYTQPPVQQQYVFYGQPALQQQAGFAQPGGLPPHLLGDQGLQGKLQ